MAFPATVGDRNLEQMHFRNSQAYVESKFPAYAPLRSTAEASALSATPDNRATLQRRFTTDSLKQPQVNVPSGWDPSSFNRLPVESLDLAPGVCSTSKSLFPSCPFQLADVTVQSSFQL
jgi:hypothetical protein